MSKCLNCGKEIPEGRKFCNHHCSASYVNTRRQRKPWTEEQRQKVRTEKYCKYCGSLLDPSKHEWKVCENCSPYVGGLAIQKKLGFTEGSLKSRDTKAFEYLSDLYFTEGLGVNDIAKRTGIRHVSLLSLFKRHGIRRLRSVSEGIQTAILTGKLQISESTHPRGRAGNHKSWNGTTFRYRSSYEKEYAESLDECKIPYFYEKVRIKYFDTQRNKERVAVPDFYLPETKELVEIKSSWTLKGKVQEMKDKFKAYREQGYNPKLILDKVEQDLSNIEE